MAEMGAAQGDQIFSPKLQASSQKLPDLSGKKSSFKPKLSIFFGQNGQVWGENSLISSRNG